MKNFPIRLFIASCFTLSIATATVPISSTFLVAAHADANQNDGDFHEQIVSSSQWGTLNPYSGTATASDSDLVNAGKKLTVTSTASASWTDADHGIVTWTHMGWKHNTIASSGAQINGFGINGPVWSYTFQAQENDTFSLSYDVRGTGDVFGLLGLSIEWSGSGGGANLIDSYNPTVSGTFTRSVVAGQTYTIGLANWGNYFSSPLLNTATGYMDADFSWAIGPAVPEPSTALAFVAGLGLLIRRRKRS